MSGSRTSGSLMAILLIFAGIQLGGCGSQDPVSSGTGSGNGYQITVSAAGNVVAPGGSLSIQAYVADPQGHPIQDGELVYFSASVGGVFEEGESGAKAKTLGGVARIVYRAPTKATDKSGALQKTEVISASYLGAFASVDVALGI